MKNVGIVGTGISIPKNILTNKDLEKMVETTDEWITTRSGIKERHIIEKGQYTSILATEASRKALESAKLKPEDLDLLIVATITPDMRFPSTACFVQRELGASKAICFDISAACAGFIYALVCAQQFIKTGFVKNALIMGAETLSTITDWQDRGTCVLFGDGAGACVLKEIDQGGILSSHLGGDGSLSDLLYMPGGGSKFPASNETIEKRMHFIKMQGNEVFKLAVRLMVDSANKALEQCGLSPSDIDWLIPHQANIRILKAVAKRLELPEEKIFFNIAKYGNMSAASTAVALCEAIEQGKFKKGDIIVLDAFGGGLVWGATVIKW
ncbi:MAG: beta-ketoacyl-ACP synthase III [Candidatus Gygaella obscura]|nr:beta-ketoacyl-ACP synthase III [Candidatus Gygaella obscura]